MALITLQIFGKIEYFVQLKVRNVVICRVITDVPNFVTIGNDTFHNLPNLKNL